MRNQGAMDQNQFIKDSLREELIQFENYLRKSVQNDNPRITDIVGYIFDTNGKRIRPILVFLSAKACGQITSETYHGAVTVELLHTASLVHDDVVDESEIRRNRPSTNAVYGNSRAVLVGDYLLSLALKESVKTNDMDIVTIIADLGLNLAEGELNQYSLANEVVIDEEEYFKVIEKKTASLMEACTVIGAKTAGAEGDAVKEFAELGRILGVAFQIRDDTFDYYHADVGKPTGNDIREGKVTLPLIYSLRNAPENLAQEMLQIIKSKDYTEENIETLLEFSKRNGGIKYAYEKMNELLLQAENIVDNLSCDDEIKRLLEYFLSYLKDRVF
jgi:octaprenyl-diphosphate synthase